MNMPVSSSTSAADRWTLSSPPAGRPRHGQGDHQSLQLGGDRPRQQQRQRHLRRFLEDRRGAAQRPDGSNQQLHRLQEVFHRARHRPQCGIVFTLNFASFFSASQSLPEYQQSCTNNAIEGKNGTTLMSMTGPMKNLLDLETLQLLVAAVRTLGGRVCSAPLLSCRVSIQ